MDPKEAANIISKVSNALASGNTDQAKACLVQEWPFASGIRAKRESVPLRLQRDLFARDQYQCRYCGRHVVVPGLLRLLSLVFPAEFPCDRAWKLDLTHPAVWLLTASADHIVPRSRGGKNDLDNLVTTCYRCNDMKGQWLLEELNWSLRSVSEEAWDGCTKAFIQIIERHPQVTDLVIGKWYQVLTTR